LLFLRAPALGQYKAIAEVPGTLLDNSMVLFASAARSIIRRS
jgi:hypothetical protein